MPGKTMMALAAAAVVGGIVAGVGQQWRLGAQLAAIRTRHAAVMKTISDEAVSAAGAAQRETARATAEIGALESQYRRENSDAKKTMDALRADVRAGAVRLRVAARCDSTGGGGVPGAGSASAGADGDGNAELDAASAGALLGVAADGDRAARKVAALQAYAREAQRVCGGQ
ncbi:lysis system i-spanin subunit Rz [Paraburkholderia bonniea]|uniref:lysis system i-spanin subunit Rz n=1 Tax=Paraburkholderia bonniea TaxID=2152891 RepID=UPI001291E9DA|nr:lysis system i-spanin subunit Rz [Paraburkholderia bonniea]